MSRVTVEEAIEDLKQGKFLIIADDENRENEGDLVMPAEKVTPEAVNFMIKHARGLLCMPVMGQRLDQLNMPLMLDGQANTKHGTAFTVSVDYSKGTTTGISSFDRAATIKAIIDPKSTDRDFVRPGHLFPLRYREGGVLARPGHTEAIVDLTRMAGMYPAGVVCEIINRDGSMARMPALEKFSKKHEMNILGIGQIIAYRRRNERLVEKVTEAKLPTSHGEFKICAYKSPVDPGEHIALVMGEWKPDEPVLVRLHSECKTGDVFQSSRCDCGSQISRTMDMIAEEGKGVLVYLQQEGRGIGLHNKIKTYALQDGGMDTIEANEILGFDSDSRHYWIGAQILRDLGAKKVRLMTNNPRKMVGLSGYDLELVERVPLEIAGGADNKEYLRTKRAKMGHILSELT